MIKRVIKEKIQAEKEKIRGMERGKALEYIWNYYKIPIVGIAVFLFLLVYFIHGFLNRPEDPLLHITWINCYDDVSEKSGFYRDFKEYAPFSEEGSVIFDTNAFFNLEKERDYSNTYFQKTVAYLEAGTTDALICQKTNLMGIAKGKRVLNLEDDSAKEIYREYQERAVFFTTEEGEEIPVGIDISDSPLIKGMNSYKEDGCYLCVSAYTERVDNVKVFLDYLFLQDQD